MFSLRKLLFVGCLAVSALLPVSAFAQQTEGALPIVLTNSPLAGGGNETTGHVRFDPTKVESGTYTLAAGATNTGLTFSTAKATSSLGVWLSQTSSNGITQSGYIASISKTGCTPTFLDSFATQTTFTYLVWPLANP